MPKTTLTQTHVYLWYQSNLKSVLLSMEHFNKTWNEIK